MNDKPSQELVKLWLEMVTGQFHYTKVCDGQFDNREHWPHLRVIMGRLVKDGEIESLGKNDGWFRIVDNHVKPLDWQDDEVETDSGLILPFNLRDHVYIYKDTTTVVAGSPNSGKTGLIYRTVYLNMYQMNTILLTNLEGGKAMLRDRFTAMGVPKPAPFIVKHVEDNYHDYIKEKNTLYAIDYIDAPEGTDFFLIAHKIKQIDQKLQGLDSVAVIGLQKPTYRDFAYGGEGTLKSPTLYVALDANKLKIIKAKVSANPAYNPNGMQWTFHYDIEGTAFKNIERFYGE